MQGIFQKENTDKALKYGIYRHLPTYEKIIRNLVSFYCKKFIYCYAPSNADTFIFEYQAIQKQSYLNLSQVYYL